MAKSEDGLPRGVVAVGDGVWNVRGSFRLGPVDLGTQVSLVRLADGRHVLLDAYTLGDDVRRWVEATAGPDGVSAIVNLHPFHTLHVRAMAAMFPAARLYGTVRHHTRFPDLPWQPERTEDAAFHALFERDFRFSVPRGVDLVPSNENLHFASVLALHRASGTLHVDDTLLYVKLPGPLRLLTNDVLRLHPTLGRVLQPRAGAASELRAWTRELVELCADVTTLCAAHSAILRTSDGGPPIADRVAEAVARVEPTIARHEARYG